MVSRCIDHSLKYNLVWRRKRHNKGNNFINIWYIFIHAFIVTYFFCNIKHYFK